MPADGRTLRLTVVMCCCCCLITEGGTLPPVTGVEVAVVGGGFVTGARCFLIAAVEEVVGDFLFVFVGAVSSSLEVAEAVVLRVSGFTSFDLLLDGGSGFFALEFVAADS